MENPFKEISSNKQVPDFLKKRVMDRVAIVKLGFEVSDLFAVKLPSVFKDLVFYDNDNDKKEI